MIVKSEKRRPVLVLKDVGVAYRRRKGFLRSERFWALKDISFTLYHGETLGVIGRNGVGKSTLLRLLSGIIEPSCGRMQCFSTRPTLLSLQAGFSNHLTGRENVILSGMFLGLTKKEVLGKMESIREYADIGEFFEQPVQEYSSGMRARLGFAIAIHCDPEVILIDEVLGVGDIDFREKSSTTMRKLIARNKSVVLVSHQLSLVQEVCRRVIWIADGGVRMEGEPEEVIEQYNQYVTAQ